MKGQLNKLLGFLDEMERPVTECFQLGKEREYISQELNRAGLKNIPSELLDIYEWRNGTRIKEGTILDDLHFFPGFYFMSLEDAMEQFFIVRTDPRWNKAWFPVFANGGGDFYILDLSQSDAESAPVIGFILNETEHPIEYQSLSAMIDTFVDCFEQGAAFVSSDACLELEDMWHARIARKHNPEVELWSM